MPRRSKEAGFTLIEVLIGLAVTAALLALIIDLLAGESLQSRRFIARGEAAVEVMQARRIFRSAAARASGPASDRQVGDLQISDDMLLLRRDAQVQPLLRWQNANARFSYSDDGAQWRSDSPEAERGLIRLTWRQDGKDHVWIAP